MWEYNSDLPREWRTSWVNIGIAFCVDRRIWSNLSQYNCQAYILFHIVVTMTWSRNALRRILSSYMVGLSLKDPLRLMWSRFLCVHVSCVVITCQILYRLTSKRVCHCSHSLYPATKHEYMKNIPLSITKFDGFTLVSAPSTTMRG